MPIHTTKLKDAFIFEPIIFNDDRGYFYESYNDKLFKELTGYEGTFIQDNQARSSKNVLRGLHFQLEPYAQTKLIRCIEGAIWDVIVDLRKDSPSYGQWIGVELTADNKLQLLVPKGFAHGYSVLSDTAEVIYKCDNFYNKSAESGISYADPVLNIDWKIDLKDAIISEKDVLLTAYQW